jgi:hypothetical protein
MPEKKIYEYNIKNARYSFDGTTVKEIGHSDSITLEVDYTEANKYGDGYIIDTLPSDKGFTGTIGLATINEEYEIDCGRKMIINDGAVVDIPILSLVKHSIYFETTSKEPGVKGVTKKTWLLGVTSGAISANLNQTTDSVNANVYSVPIKSLGTLLKQDDGITDYIDTNGNTIVVRKISSLPGDTGYDTFGDTVPVPKKTVV